MYLLEHDEAVEKNEIVRELANSMSFTAVIEL